MFHFDVMTIVASMAAARAMGQVWFWTEDWKNRGRLKVRVTESEHIEV
jgi:hypothetical protein